MTRPEHFISDAKAYRKQMADRMATLLEWARKAAEGSKEQVEWGGRFLECRGQLAELDQMIGAWEKGWPAFRVTEELIAQEDHGDDDDEEIWGSYRGDPGREDFHSDG